MHSKFLFLLCAALWLGQLTATNQTDTTSPILPGAVLPFRFEIVQADFSLPNGLHSCAFANYKGKWLLLCGRTNGIHTFNDDPNNFPPESQNRVAYVIDPKRKKTYARALTDPASGLTTQQIDELSVTSPQSYRRHKTLYITGGYGVDTTTGQFTTKTALTAIDIKGMMHWVMHPHHSGTASQHLRQLHDPTFQVTGGYMDQIKGHPTLLIFGQDFEGFYLDPVSNGIYTEQVRRFTIHDDGHKLSATLYAPYPVFPDPNFRRRDLNVVPIIKSKANKLTAEFVALSGVFTPSVGIWTVPVKITAAGKTHMADPTLPTTFKQGMNNYASATLGLFSAKRGTMYTLLFGGISYGYFQNGQFTTDSNFPFINQVTTVAIDSKGHYTQYIMDQQFPVILSTQSHPGNPLLFGASALVMNNRWVPSYRNGVIKLDKIGQKPKLVGYIVGGIQSTVPNTSVASDSAASPYIFKILLSRKRD